MRVALLLAVLASPALAEQSDISEAEWRALALGRTLVYTEDGVFGGLERYAPAGNRVEWQFPNGDCTYGTWEVIDGIFCFNWEQLSLQCYRHVRDGERILVIGTDASPGPGEVTEVVDITDRALTCGMPMS